jgi:hypothetical protein
MGVDNVRFIDDFYARDWRVPWQSSWPRYELIADDGTENFLLLDYLDGMMLPSFSESAREVLAPFMPRGSEWLPHHYQGRIFWGVHLYDSVPASCIDHQHSEGLEFSSDWLQGYNSLTLRVPVQFMGRDIINIRPAITRWIFVSDRVRDRIERAELTGFTFVSPITLQASH